MEYALVSPQPRGQITLPVKLREKYGIKPGMQLKVEDIDGKIILRPYNATTVIPPKYSKKESMKRLEALEKNRTALWTKADDRKLAALKKKDYKYLDW